MGFRIEVLIWQNLHGNGYTYVPFWEGQSLIRALWEGRKAHRQGIGCVQILWRPR